MYSGYGGAATNLGHSSARGGLLFKGTHQRQRLNIVPVLLCILLPTGLFCLVSYALAFKYRFEQPAAVWGVVAAAIVVTLACGFLAWEQKYRRGGGAERTPSWIIFCFLSFVLAVLSGVASGCENYAVNTQKYFYMGNLMEYTNINTNKMRGQQMMDAGMVTFANETRIDVSKSMGFMNGNMYCVAPIVYRTEAMPTYDFWAVGQGCCSVSKADFHCKGFSNPLAHGALRVMDDTQHLYYRLAVQQAEATHDIQAVHPLFFEWVTDAPAEVKTWLSSGEEFYKTCAFFYFVVQFFLVLAASMAFWKIGQIS
jgi:hypothetical protein